MGILNGLSNHLGAKANDLINVEALLLFINLKQSSVPDYALFGASQRRKPLDDQAHRTPSFHCTILSHCEKEERPEMCDPMDFRDSL